MLRSIVLILVLIVCFHGSHGVDFGSCETLTRTFAGKLNNTCASVVDYSFFVPPGQTAQSLADQVANRLGNTTMKTWATDCQAAYRNYVCAEVYLKCYPNVQLDRIVTYNPAIYLSVGANFRVPVVRPCWSTCNTVHEKCMGLFHVQNAYPDCKAQYDYSRGAYTGPAVTPDLYDNTTSCSAPLDVAVAKSREEYQYKRGGVCAGLVDNVFVPPGSAVAPYYSVLQEEYVVQSLIEDQLSTRIGAIPGWLQADCKFALLKYLCLSVFLHPQDVSMSSVLLAAGLTLTQKPIVDTRFPTLWDYHLTLPSFPEKAICTEYADICSTFIKFANKTALNPTCDANSTLLPVAKFPSGRQLISTNYIQSFGRYAKFYTDAYNASYFNASEYVEYTASCPDGYVYPEHPNNTHNIMIGITGCAVACRPRVWTDDEWMVLDKQSLNIPIAGVLLTVLLAFSAYPRFSDPRNNYLMILYAVLAFVASIVSVANNQQNPDDRWCYDNSINIQQEMVTDSACVAQGGVLVYTFLSCCGVTFFMILDVLLRLKGWNALHDSPYYVGVQVFMVLGLPLIPAIYAGQKNMYGFSRSSPYCFIMTAPYATKWIDLALVAIPIVIIAIMSFIVFVTVLVLLCCRRKQTHKILAVNEESDKGTAESGPVEDTRTVRHRTTTLIFVGVMFAIWLGWSVIKGEFYNQRDEQLANFTEWTQCIFKNYNGDNDHANSICGEVFKGQPKLGGQVWQLLCLSGTSIIISVIYMVDAAYNNCRPIPEESSSGRITEVRPAAVRTAPAAAATASPGFLLAPMKEGQSASSGNQVKALGEIELV